MPGLLGTLKLANVMQGIKQIVKVMQGAVAVWSNGYYDPNMYTFGYVGGYKFSVISKTSPHTIVRSEIFSNPYLIKTDKDYYYLMDNGYSGGGQRFCKKYSKATGALVGTWTSPLGGATFYTCPMIVDGFIYVTMFWNGTPRNTKIYKVNTATMSTSSEAYYESTEYTAQNGLLVGENVIIFIGAHWVTFNKDTLVYQSHIDESGYKANVTQTDGTTVWLVNNAAKFERYLLSDLTTYLTRVVNVKLGAPLTFSGEYLYTLGTDSGSDKVTKYNKDTLAIMTRGVNVASAVGLFYDATQDLIITASGTGIVSYRATDLVEVSTDATILAHYGANDGQDMQE